MIWFRKKKQLSVGDDSESDDRVARVLAQTKEAEKLVNEYGAVLEKVSGSTFGSPESLLPRPKSEMKTAIAKYLFFLHKTNNLDSGSLDVLKAGYMQLATFIDDEEAKLADVAQTAYDTADIEKMAGPEVERAVERMSEILQEQARLMSEFDDLLKVCGIEM